MWGMRFHGWVGAILAAAVCAACAGTPRPGTSHDRVISSSELASSSSTTIHEAIDRLRPAWLGDRDTPGGRMAPAPSVYMNRLYLGGSDVLATVRVRDVVEVRLISPDLARDRYGSRNPAGVIELVTRDVGAYE